LSATTAAIATVLTIGLVRQLPHQTTGVRIPWPALAALFALSEAFVVHLQFRRGDAHSFSLNEVTLVLGLFFTDPVGVVLAQLIGAALALTLRRRQQPIKLAFNLGHLTMEAAVATVAFAGMVGTAKPLGPAGWIAAMTVCAVASLIAGFLVQAAIALSQGRFVPRIAIRNLGFALIVAMCNASLGLAAATMLARDPRSVWLMVSPVIVVFFAYRGYSRQRQKHEGLEFLYESTRLLQRAEKFDDALLRLLEQVRTMFRAEIARVTFFAVDGEPSARTTLGPGEASSVMQEVELDPREGVWARIAAEAQGVLLTHPIRNERIRAYYARDGIRDAMVAPIYGQSGVVGTLLVGNRLGEVGSFDVADLRLFETLANHASVSLQKARLVSRLEDALAHMTEINRLKDDFVATISHELRTPLTSILGFVQTLLRPDATFRPEDQREFLGVVERQGRRLHSLIEDLLAVARLETDEIRPTPHLVSIQGLVRQGVESMTLGRSSRVEVVFDEPLPLINTDQEMVVRILTNLLDNAFKYSPDGSIVTVCARAEGAGVTLSVNDHGYGIPEEMRERIFERFFQVDQSKTRVFGGAGLGLYICRRLAEGIRGRIWLERTGPEGSMFSLWMPELSRELRSEAGLPMVGAIRS
jgi:signal transduction histidine kinase